MISYKVSRSSLQNDSKAVTNGHNKKVPKEKYTYPEEKQETIDDLRLISQYNNGILKNNKFDRQYTKSSI